jgi:tRNA 5-methylaminomethyl-2-thiouridine biosynthesis bifunctional protein
MKRENTPWRPLSPATIEWTAAGEPQSLSFGDIYYSRDGGAEESRYVFLQGNDLPQRWRHWREQRFCIAETGFGTGLNFLLTWQAWLALPAPRPDLHYLAVEKFPLSPSDLARALSAWPELSGLAHELLAAYPGLVPGQHRRLFAQGQLTLDLWWEDVADALPDLASHDLPMVDAWYLDGFAPARNEAMWRGTVLEAVARLSRPQASFSTFTAAGAVRRQLADAGFAVAKVPGYGRKRECLRGVLTQRAPGQSEPQETPWDLPADVTEKPRRAIVLGAGLAGCTVAAALARRGIEVTLLDRDVLAGGASGNDQGVLYTRLSRRHSALTDFSLQSFCFSSAFLLTLFDQDRLVDGVDGSLCGSFHQSHRQAELAELAEKLQAVPELAQVLSAAQASARLGIEQPGQGYWYPRSGWLHPAALCRALAAEPGVTLVEHCGELDLTRNGDNWRAGAGDGQYWEAPCAVIATGLDTTRLAGLDWLPLQPVRGQTSTLPASTSSAALRAVLCHEGYIAPERNGSHCIGASFNPGDTDSQRRAADDRANLQALARAVPDWAGMLAQQDLAATGSRVGFRCASPDYLPLAGPVPDREAFLLRFASLRRNARTPIATRGQYLPGLYLSTAHGSRGLTSTPLAAELLASQVCGEPPPMSRELIRAIAPARFIIRDLCRNKP